MIEKAIFGAGCFWGVEAAFRAVEGVRGAICGYSGGHWKNPTYHDVCTGQTGHAEVVQVEYDASQVSYDACSTCSGIAIIQPRSTVRGRILARSIARQYFFIRPSRKPRRELRERSRSNSDVGADRSLLKSCLLAIFTPPRSITNAILKSAALPDTATLKCA
jgi:hypothetical protein